MRLDEPDTKIHTNNLHHSQLIIATDDRRLIDLPAYINPVSEFDPLDSREKRPHNRCCGALSAASVKFYSIRADTQML